MGTPRIDLDRIAFIGRTYDEYVSMFDLDESLLKKGFLKGSPGAVSPG